MARIFAVRQNNGITCRNTPHLRGLERVLDCPLQEALIYFFQFHFFSWGQHSAGLAVQFAWFLKNIDQFGICFLSPPTSKLNALQN